MEALAGKTMYMVFSYPTADLPRSQWTIVVHKDGEEMPEIAVDVGYREGKYVFTFDNDGTDKSTWQLTVTPVENTSVHYVETWFVRKNFIEQSVSELRSRMDSEAGFFNTSINQPK
jgi:hypothetical protein